jgi:3-oxoadipate enol-lactonase
LLVETNDISTYCVVEGEGIPVVFLHSLGATHRVFEQQIVHLSPSYKVIAYDLRGHGNSSLGKRSPSLQVLAEDLSALLRVLNVSRAHFVGQSIGGMVLLVFATSMMSEGGTLSLFDTLGWTDREWDQRYEERARLVEMRGMDAVARSVAERSFSETTRRERPELVEKYAEWLRASPPDGYAWACRAMVNFDLRPNLASIRSPAQFLAGSEDEVTTIAHARELAHGSWPL